MSGSVDGTRVCATIAREEVVSRRAELWPVLSGCRGAFVGVAMFSGMSNLLMLTGACFYAASLRSGSAKP
jgi:ABC-type protease/lipase transport system fused ATPase/permease subunit